MLLLFRSAVNCGFEYIKINPLLIVKVGLAQHRLAAFNARDGDTLLCGSSLDEALQTNEAPALDPEWATANCKKLAALQRSSGTTPILHLAWPERVATTNGAITTLPSHLTAVAVRRSAKYANMTGTAHTHHWLASRDPEKNWTEPLMGWTSSSDPYASMAPLSFPNETSAVSFCEKNGYSWSVQRQPPSIRNPVVRRYQNNFHWSRRCRLSTR